jgi:LDH2 family malate/lactate/ureidoglycolate dehydrogenase
LVVEALAGALTGAGVVSEVEPPESQGALIMAIDIAAFGSPADSTRDLDAAITWIRTSPSSDGKPIRIPGENRNDGAGAEVSIAAGLWDLLVELSDRLGVHAPDPQEPRIG